ncbi:MAG: hypothetical protein M1819_004462 [Sarea resinae]|nr:MAG: hypothetical protein M1819_004462 [Sarea resinae]
MEMSYPYPIRSKFDPENSHINIDHNMVSPLKADGSDFPCKGHHKHVSKHTTATYQAGSSYNMTVAGDAIYDVRSCQLSLSYDHGATWNVIQSYIGDCPSPSKYDFAIPSFAPSGTALLAWSRVSLAASDGNFYMNCAQVDIVASPPPGRYRRRAAVGSSANSMAELPNMFTANLEKKSTCRMLERKGSDVVNPSAAAPVDYGSEKMSSMPVGMELCVGDVMEDPASLSPGTATASSSFSTAIANTTATSSSSPSNLPIITSGAVSVAASSSPGTWTNTTTTTATSTLYDDPNDGGGADNYENLTMTSTTTVVETVYGPSPTAPAISPTTTDLMDPDCECDPHADPVTIPVYTTFLENPAQAADGAAPTQTVTISLLLSDPNQSAELEWLSEIGMAQPSFYTTRYETETENPESAVPSYSTSTSSSVASATPSIEHPQRLYALHFGASSPLASSKTPATSSSSSHLRTVSETRTVVHTVTETRISTRTRLSSSETKVPTATSVSHTTVPWTVLVQPLPSLPTSSRSPTSIERSSTSSLASGRLPATTSTHPHPMTTSRGVSWSNSSSLSSIHIALTTASRSDSHLNTTRNSTAASTAHSFSIQRSISPPPQSAISSLSSPSSKPSTSTLTSTSTPPTLDRQDDTLTTADTDTDTITETTDTDTISDTDTSKAASITTSDQQETCTVEGALRWRADTASVSSSISTPAFNASSNNASAGASTAITPSPNIDTDADTATDTDTQSITNREWQQCLHGIWTAI